MEPALLFLLAVSNCLLLLTDAQSAECQNSYIAFAEANVNANCRDALGYVTNGNILEPLRQTFSTADLDTLCSGPTGSNCQGLFLTYINRCITATTIGGTPEFYTGTLDMSSLSDIVNAVCRKDCVAAGQYCYSTVRDALNNVVCDDVNGTYSSACQQALDQSGCCGQNAFRSKNSRVDTACCLQDFDATCLGLNVSCPAGSLPQCAEGEAYRTCGPAQEGTCDDPMPIIVQVCTCPGCYCMEGYVRHEGNCINVTDCPVIITCASSPCQKGGTCTQLAGTYTCTCRNGYTGNVCQSGPHVDLLTVEKEVEYSKVARDSVDKIADVWGTAGAILSTFSFERIGDVGEYSYLMDSGTTIYKVEVDSTGDSDEMSWKITRYQ